jgi:hypothetical protein
MAAVFALVFLFALASSILFVKGITLASFGTLFAGVMFLALASGVFIGLYRMAKRWEDEA